MVLSRVDQLPQPGSIKDEESAGKGRVLDETLSPVLGKLKLVPDLIEESTPQLSIELRKPFDQVPPRRVSLVRRNGANADASLGEVESGGFTRVQQHQVKFLVPEHGRRLIGGCAGGKEEAGQAELPQYGNHFREGVAQRVVTGQHDRTGRKRQLLFRPTKEIFWRDDVIALLEKLQLPSQRIGMHQVAVQSWIPDVISDWKHAMVSHDRWPSASGVAKVPALGQNGKDEVLQRGTDESQGLPLVRFGRIVPRNPGSCRLGLRLAATGSRFSSITRIAIEELETDWKRVVQSVGRVVNEDRLLVLAPVTIACQRVT